MPTRVSPGVSVSVDNQSYYTPGAASTVPLFIVATKGSKKNLSNNTAVGTTQSGVVQIVTSIPQSLELFGVPHFHGHGDARNEYGLFALNHFLEVGARAYVLRADVDLDDSEAGDTFMSLGTPVIIPSTATFFGEGEGHLANVVVKSNLVKPQMFSIEFIVGTDPSVTVPQYVVRSEQFGFVSNEVLPSDTVNYINGGNGRGEVGKVFKNSMIEFKVVSDGVDFVAGDVFTFQVGYAATAGSTNVGNGVIESLVVDSLLVSGEVFTVNLLSNTAFEVVGTNSGVAGISGTVGVPFDNNKISFVLTDGSVDFVAGDSFTITATEVTVPNPLGETDAQRRVKIVNALQAVVNSNQDIRSPYYEFNLVACPGYPEVADELQRLIVDLNIDYEAVAINDVPVTKSPEQAAVWAMGTERVRSDWNAYYYPWALMSNIDGNDVLVPPSAVAIHTIANSDNISYPWMAPAGEGNGDVVGVTKIGYVTGQIGVNAKFVEVEINRGRMDILYEYDKNINPIQFIPGRGFKIMGQKTSSSSASATDRISTVRLICDMKRKLRKGSFPYLFKPNDKMTRDSLKSNADNILADYMAKRALYDYVTVCDTTNNTPDRIDRNEMWLNVGIKPKKDAEFIMVPIRVVNTGTSF